jgi:hypothetical protein
MMLRPYPHPEPASAAHSRASLIAENRTRLEHDAHVTAEASLPASFHAPRAPSRPGTP